MRIAGIRVVAAAAIFLALHAIFGRERIRGRGDLARLAGLSVLGVSANQGLFVLGLARTTALNAQLIITSVPALTVAAALFLGRESASPGKLAGVAVAASGALYLVGVERFQPGASLGDALIFGNSACYAFYLVLGRDLLAKYRPLTVATWVFVFGAGPLVLLALASGGAALVVPSNKVLVVLAFVVLGPSVGSYLLNAWALVRARSSLVAIYVYGQPLVTTALMGFLLHERPSVRSLPSALLIFGGVAMVAWAERGGAPRSGAPTKPI